jgi:hypothetical protein
VLPHHFRVDFDYLRKLNHSPRITARSVETGDHVELDRVTAEAKDDWNCGRCGLRGERRSRHAPTLNAQEIVRRPRAGSAPGWDDVRECCAAPRGSRRRPQNVRGKHGHPLREMICHSGRARATRSSTAVALPRDTTSSQRTLKRYLSFKNAGCSDRLALLSLSRGTRQHRFLVATQVDYIRSTDRGCVDS